MKAVASAVLAGTKYDGKIDVEYLWHKTRERHPEIINPVRAKNHENRRVCSTQPYVCVDQIGQSCTRLNILHADAAQRHYRPSGDQLA